MTDSTRVVACEEVISTDLDGEAVLMHVSKGLYFGLNAVGSVVWDLIRNPVSVNHLCDTVAGQFEVSREVVDRDVVALLEQLRENGLARVVDPQA